MPSMKWDAMQISVFWSATVSAFCSLIVFATYFVSKKWRNELNDLKKIIIVMCIYHFIYCFAYVEVDTSGDDTLCRVQASILQFFGVGTIIYEGILSVECYTQFTAVFEGTFGKSSLAAANRERYVVKFLMENRRRRHTIYHLTVALFGVVTVTIINAWNLYGPSSKIDTVCWVKDFAFNIVFGVVPMAISIVAVILLNGRIIYMLAKTFGDAATDSTVRIKVNENQEGSPVKSMIQAASNKHSAAVDSLMVPLQPCFNTVSLFYRLSPRSQHAFHRLICIPVGFLLLSTPGLVRRILITSGRSSDSLYSLSTVTLMLAASGGTMNAIIWVFTDGAVMRDWKCVIGKLCSLCGAICCCDENEYHRLTNPGDCSSRIDCGFGIRNSSFSGPESEYSEQNEGAVESALGHHPHDCKQQCYENNNTEIGEENTEDVNLKQQIPTSDDELNKYYS